jgi:hypothetical protein
MMRMSRIRGKMAEIAQETLKAGHDKLRNDDCFWINKGKSASG